MTFWRIQTGRGFDSRQLHKENILNLKQTRRYVIVIIFTLAAILTPPDPITQVGLAIPLLILYELSIITVRFTEKKNNSENIKDA